MKVLIQRVKQASVTINDTLYSSIDKGILTFVGIEKGDTIENLKKSVQKIVKLRIFADENEPLTPEESPTNKTSLPFSRSGRIASVYV